MNTIHFAVVLCFGVVFALGEPPKPAATEALSPDFARWETILAARERRANLLRDEIKTMDARIEARGDALLESLRFIGDSNDSRSKVARMKEETIKGIRSNIEYYRSKRAALKEELRRPTLNLTDVEKRTMMAAFDERIEKRIGQILDMLKSLPTPKEYERYKIEGSNWAGPVYAVNEDYVQNQRLVTITNRLQKEIEADLRKSIARLERDNDILRAELRASNYSSPKDLTGEMAKNDALIEERRDQIAMVRSFVSTPTRKISQREAIDFDRERNRTVAELRRDFDNLFARYNNLLPELCIINDTRAAIAAAKVRAKKTVPAPSPRVR